MKDIIISNYIKKISYDDIDLFAKKNNIILNNNKIYIIYNIIKTKWKTIIYENPSSILNSIKNCFDEETFKKIEILLYTYKERYKNFI